MQRQVPTWLAIVLIVLTVVVVWLVYAWWTRPKPAPVPDGAGPRSPRRPLPETTQLWDDGHHPVGHHLRGLLNG